jgi:Arc/MetJ-type ribon-helix-helix transcriptional regulator
MSDTVILSFKVPAQLVERLDELVREGLFRNRSEALRHALVLLINQYRGRGLGEAWRGGSASAEAVKEGNI